MTFFKMQEGSLRGFARPQALTCQGRRRSAAAAHAKGPARPVMKLALRAQGLWRKDPQILKFFWGLYCNFFSKPALRCPRPRPRRLAPLRCASLHPPSLRSGSARRPNALRAAQQNFLLQYFLLQSIKPVLQ